MAKTNTSFANLEFTTFVRSGSKYEDRLDKFLDKFYNQDKFLTDHGLVTVFSCEIGLCMIRSSWVSHNNKNEA